MLAVRRPRGRPSRTPRPPTRPGSTSRCSRPARTTSRGAGAAVRRGRRRRGRQLLGLADGPRRPARWSPRSTRTPIAEAPQGDHRQPELHHDGRDAGAQAAARRGRAGPAGRVDLPGGLRQRPRRRRGARRPGRGRRRQGAASWPTTARRSTFPDAGEVRPARSPTTCCRWPARSSTTAATRPTRSRSSATRPARSSTSPTCWSPAPACGCRSSPATRCRSTPSSPAAAVGQARPRDPRRRPRASSSVRRPDPAAGGRQRPVVRRPDPAGPGRRRRARAGAVRLQRQPPQGRRAQHRADRRAGRRHR